MSAEKENARLQQLKGAVNLAVRYAESSTADSPHNADKSSYMESLKDKLKGMQESIEHFEKLLQGEEKPKIGIFGAPSRGKSTLLNALLGIDMLPMDGQHGTTRFGTYLIKRAIKNEKRPYEIKRILKREALESKQCAPEDVGTVLRHYSSKEADEKEAKTERIEILGPFEPYIDDDLIFVDTPGIAEAGESLSAGTHNWAKDRTYALEVLSKVDIVIFCMRADEQSRSDVDLYDKVIVDRYEPINVITFANKRDEEDTIDDLKKYLLKFYTALMLADTVAVDAKKAVEIIAEAKAGGKNVKEAMEEGFKGENLEGFRELKELIHDRIGLGEKEQVEKRVARFEELYNGLKRDAYEKYQLTLPGTTGADLYTPTPTDPAPDKPAPEPPPPKKPAPVPIPPIDPVEKKKKRKRGCLIWFFIIAAVVGVIIAISGGGF